MNFLYKSLPLLAILLGTLLAGCSEESPKHKDVVTIKVGHVGHDHHLALFVAADKSKEFSKTSGVELKKIEDRKRYELFKSGKKLANVEIVKVGGGSKMPTALAQGVIDMGFGGTAPTLASIDKGAPVRLIAPLHYKGDMFVLKPDFPTNSWQEFVDFAKKTDKPVRIGYKAPNAVAKIIFEKALKHEGITYSGNLAESNVKVHMINVKGGGKLNTSIASGLIDGYTGNNPFPAIGKEKGILKVVSDLEELPPGTFRDHPCCCIAANCTAITEKGEAIAALLTLCQQATKLINTDLNLATEVATRWIGTSKTVELNSIPTSGYSMDASPKWRGHMTTWFVEMNALGLFTGKLKGLSEEKVARVAYELSLLDEATKQLEK